MVPYKLVIRHRKNGTEDVSTGSIPDDLWALLLTFRDEATRLADCEWVKSGLPGTYKVHYEAGAMNVELIDAPSNSAISEILHCLRPFLLQSETLYYPRVASRVFTSFEHQLFRRILASNRAMFDGKNMRQAFIIQANDLELNSERAFELRIDAFEYHRHGKDTRAKERFLKQHGGPPDDLALAVFRDMLRGNVFAIQNMADLVTTIEKSPTYAAHLRSESDVA